MVLSSLSCSLPRIWSNKEEVKIEKKRGREERWREREGDEGDEGDTGVDGLEHKCDEIVKEVITIREREQKRERERESSRDIEMDTYIPMKCYTNKSNHKSLSLILRNDQNLFFFFT